MKEMNNKDELTQFYLELYQLLPNRYNNYYLQNINKINDEIPHHKLYCDYCYNNFDLFKDTFQFVKRKDIQTLKLYKGNVKNTINTYNVMKIKCNNCNKTSHSFKPKKKKSQNNQRNVTNNVINNILNNNHNINKPTNDNELRTLLVKKMAENSRTEEELKQKEAQLNLLSFLKKLN